MTVLQPLYFSAGRYTASTDRKLISALMDAESDGTRVNGIFPPTSRMALTASSLSVLVSPGLCAIQDQSSQNASSPGTYLCSIDTNSETVSLDSNSSGGNPRLDLIYAEVDETPYVITNKQITSNVATITTSANHGFLVNQTVIITGVDDTFNGSYVIDTAPSGAPTQFTFTKTAADAPSTAVGPTARVNDVIVSVTSYSVASNIVSLTTSTQSTQFAAKDTLVVSGVGPAIDGTYEVRGSSGTTNVSFYRLLADTSASVTTSSAAQARVPFAIKRVTGTPAASPVAPSLPAGKTAMKLGVARVTTSNTVTIEQDLRSYVTSVGGVTLWNSTNTGAATPAGAPGRLRFDTATNKLDFWDAAAANWKIIYTNAAGFDNTHNHNTVYKQGVQSSAGVLAAPVSTSSSSTTITVPGNSGTYAALSVDQFVNFTTLDACYVLVQASMWLDSDSSATYGRVGIQATGATTIGLFNTTVDGTASQYGDVAQVAYGDTAGYQRDHSINRVMKLSAGTTKIQLVGTKNSTTGTISVQYPSLRVIPLYKA